MLIPMTEPTSFGEKLRTRRDALRLSGNRLAILSGVDQAYLSKIERGIRQPTGEVIAKIAPVLGVPLAEVQAWADADRLGEDRVKAVQAHAIKEPAAPQMTVDEWIEAIRNLPPEEKAKARRDLEAALRALEGQE